MSIESIKNAERFKGFADMYDNSRPVMPLYPIGIIKKYLGHSPDVVIDLGCGTGLSTAIWENNCNKVIGIEPSDDMRTVAESKQRGTVVFQKGYSHDTGLNSEVADVVICSQSFHWMEPTATLREVNRILRNKGLFVTVDYDWPPVSNWQVEKEYINLFDKVNELESNYSELKSSFVQYSKSCHLENIINSEYFTYAREIVFSNTEKCNASRLINLATSQGGLQGVLRFNSSLIDDEFNNFVSLVHSTFDTREFDIDFSYRMRIAVKEITK